MKSPLCLIKSLEEYGIKPSGDKDTDQLVLAQATLDRERARKERCVDIRQAILNAYSEHFSEEHFDDLSDPTVYNRHAMMVVWIANNIILKGQKRVFEIDDDNKLVIRFLLYYFNNCPLAEKVFPERGYKLHKNIYLHGASGAGKTLIMQIFSEYLRQIHSPRQFHNLTVSQMANYYTRNNNLDLYTFNECCGKGFEGEPVNVCLNDIGVETASFYGTDTLQLTCDFMYARNDIWTQQHRFAHLTSNLDIDDLANVFHDKYDRIMDRFKTYNDVPLPGGSRR